MKKFLPYLIAVALFLISGGISYMLFSQVAKQVIVTPPAKLANGSLQFDNSLPKIEACPLNGVKYSTQQKQWWEGHEPLGVMIENSVDARPQSGLSYADVVYEAVAEGGITRFLAVFYCQDAPEIGPVRSARTYFIDMMSQYGTYPLYAHVGGANADGPANALGQLDDYGWSSYNDMNQFSIGFPTFWRDYTRQGRTVATEHTMYSTTTKLWDFAKTQRDITNVTKAGPWDANYTPYTFKEDPALSARPTSQTVHLNFWEDQEYAVDWMYDRVNNNYKRNNGGVPHIDIDTKKQLTAKQVVVLLMDQSNADDGYANNEHLLYTDEGTGKALIFMDGKEVKGTWKKASRKAQLFISDASGTPVSFDRGNIWFSILPTDATITVK